MGSRWLCRYGVLLVFAPSLLVAAAGEKAHSGVPASVQGRPSQAALPNPQPFYERPFGHQLPVSVTSEGWSITLDGSEPCGQCPGAKAWVFTAVKKDGGGSHKLRLTKSPIQIDQINLVNESRFVVFGRNTSNAVVVNILALPTGAELDSFMCYNPALS